MADPAHYRALEGMYHGTGINRIFDPRLAIAQSGHAEVHAEVREEWFHAAQSLHGSVYFKMLDDAAFFAAQSMVTDRFLLTAQFNLYFTRPITDGTMRAEGQVTTRTRTQYVCESHLYCNDKLAAHGSGLFVPGRMALGPEVGYHRG